MSGPAVRRRALLALAGGAVLAGALPARARPAATLKITGSSTMTPLVRAMAERFVRARPDVRIDVQPGGSQRAVDDVRSGAADLGMVARVLRSEERDLIGYAIARDGVAFVVHRDNPVPALTRAQLQAILSGRAPNWQPFGGPAGPIRVLSRERGRSALLLACDYLDLAPEAIRAERTLGDNAPLIEAVAADRQAIGLLSVGAAQSAVNAGRPIRALPLEGVAATVRELARGAYPLQRPLLLLARDRPVGTVRAFVEIALSDPARELIEQHDLVAYRD